MINKTCSWIPNTCRPLPSSIVAPHHSLFPLEQNLRNRPPLLFHPRSISFFMFFLSFYRLLENEKLLLILANRDNFFVYLGHLSSLDSAINQGRYIKCLNRDRLGQSVLFSFDEAKRILAVCGSTKVVSGLSSDLDNSDIVARPVTPPHVRL